MHLIELEPYYKDLTSLPSTHSHLRMKELYFVLVLLLEGFSAANIPSLRGDGSEVEHQPRFGRDKQVEPLQCGAKDKLKDSEYAMIESPDFPDPYPNNVKCKYTIKVTTSSYSLTVSKCI